MRTARREKQVVWSTCSIIESMIEVGLEELGSRGWRLERCALGARFGGIGGRYSSDRDIKRKTILMLYTDSPWRSDDRLYSRRKVGGDNKGLQNYFWNLSALMRLPLACLFSVQPLKGADYSSPRGLFAFLLSTLKHTLFLFIHSTASQNLIIFFFLILLSIPLPCNLRSLTINA